MKKSMIFLCLIAAGVAFADNTTTGANTYGVLRVDSSAAETIVAVPWVGASSDGSASIQVADIVKTANLNNGDELYAYIGGEFKAWILNDNTWTPQHIVNSDGPANTAGSASQTLTRGQAILLRRKAPIANCFYVFGQVASTSTAELTIAVGTPETPAYTLIAPPVDAEIADLNTIIEYKSGTPLTGDIIFVAASSGKSGLMTDYHWNGTEWGKYQRATTMGGSETFVAGLSIPVGEGAWYVSKGGNPVITWKNLPSAQ